MQYIIYKTNIHNKDLVSTRPLFIWPHGTATATRTATANNPITSNTLDVNIVVKRTLAVVAMGDSMRPLPTIRPDTLVCQTL